MEVVIVVDEIDLHSGGLDGCHFDDERVVCFIDNDVHSRKSDDLVQLVSSFVDHSPAGHESSDFLPAFLEHGGKFASVLAGHTFGNIGDNLLGDEKNLLTLHYKRWLFFYRSVCFACRAIFDQG